MPPACWGSASRSYHAGSYVRPLSHAHLFQEAAAHARRAEDRGVTIDVMPLVDGVSGVRSAEFLRSAAVEERYGKLLHRVAFSVAHVPHIRALDAYSHENGTPA